MSWKHYNLGTELQIHSKSNICHELLQILYKLVSQYYEK